MEVKIRVHKEVLKEKKEEKVPKERKKSPRLNLYREKRVNGSRGAGRGGCCNML